MARHSFKDVSFSTNFTYIALLIYNVNVHVHTTI